MPLPVAALIGAGASLVGQGINAFSSGQMNKKTRQWNEKMYDRQKQDNLDFWNTQNTYNSPEEQMKRLQEAGLNPNMVYGNGSAANTASGLNAPSALPYKPNAPTVDMPSVVNSYYDVKMKQATYDNVKAQGDLLWLDAIKKSQENQFFHETFNYRKEGTKHANQSIYEDVIRKASENILNTGYQSPHLSGGASDFTKDSRYSLQMRSLGLSNELREKESKNKDVDFDINKLRRDFNERQWRGDMTSLTFKDWLQMILGQVRPR